VLVAVLEERPDVPNNAANKAFILVFAGVVVVEGAVVVVVKRGKPRSVLDVVVGVVGVAGAGVLAVVKTRFGKIEDIPPWLNSIANKKAVLLVFAVAGVGTFATGLEDKNLFP
jgi:hypothetical protein